MIESPPLGTKANNSKGGIVLWVELPKSRDSLELFSRVLKQDIAFAPGTLISIQGKYNNFMRLNAGILNNQITTVLIKLPEMMR